jgi:hypothetical protein
MKKILMHTIGVIDSIGKSRKKGDSLHIIQEMRTVNGMSTTPSKLEKDFSSKSKITCKTDDIGLESFLICLEEKPKKCTFSTLFGDRYFCKKPLSLE